MTSAAPPASSRGATIGRAVLGLLLVLEIVGSGYAVAHKVVPLWNDRWAQDDAYVSFRYAKNFVHGDGLVYNVGARVEGYTNFLWTMLSALPLARGTKDPLPFMHAVGLTLWVLSYVLLLALGVQLFREGMWIAPLALVPLVSHWSFNMWFLSGMETPLVSFLTILAVVLFSSDPEAHPWALTGASLAGVALTMTRPDGVVTLAALAIAGMVLHWRRLFVERKWRTYVFLPLLPVLLLYVPYNIWRVAYYGSFYPNTYYAKLAYLSYYPRGWDYLRTYVAVYALWPYIGLVAAGAVLAPGGTARRYLWATLLVSACSFFYVVRLGGDFMEWRFVTPVTGVLYPAIVIGAAVCALRVWSFVSRLVRRRSSKSGVASPVARAAGCLVGAGVMFALAVTTVRAIPTAQSAKVAGQETISLLRRYCDPKQFDWGAAGKLFDEVLPHDVTIATTSAGIIPFFCNRPCLDLVGLTDPEIAHSPVDVNNRGRMGHEHWLQDYDRMRERGVDILLLWVDPKPFAMSLLTPPHNDLELVSARLPSGSYVQFVILNHRTVDREALRTDKRLVFFGDLPLADHATFHALQNMFSSYTVVDTLALEDEASQQAHAFEEIFDPQVPLHNWHDKMLPYREPLDKILVRDVGRRIPNQARWNVNNVSSRSDLIMIIRYDHTGTGIYAVEVNGHKLEGGLNLPSAAEAWDEAWVKIPARLLVDGLNTFRLIRTADSPGDSELYRMWFLQPAVDGKS